jgi:hypothetical protein
VEISKAVHVMVVKMICFFVMVVGVVVVLLLVVAGVLDLLLIVAFVVVVVGNILDIRCQVSVNIDDHET